MLIHNFVSLICHLKSVIIPKCELENTIAPHIGSVFKHYVDYTSTGFTSATQ